MSHSFFSPSKGAMWMECFGALGQPENQSEDEESSEFADNGTASHTLAAMCFDRKNNCDAYIGQKIRVNGTDYEVDEERATYVQSYVDDIRRTAMGGILWSEHRVDLSKYLGHAVCPTCKGHRTIDGETRCPTCDGDGEVPQGGTSDAVVILPKKRKAYVSDLKYGVGEKVYASYPGPDGKRLINHQTGLYALGVLEDILLMGYEIDEVEVSIYQPRLDWIDRFTISVVDLLGAFAARVVLAAERSGFAMTQPPNKLDELGLLTPGAKTCRWCKAVANCQANRRFIQETTRVDFDDETVEPVVPQNTEELAKAYAALPLVRQWLKAVDAAIWQGVQNGQEIIGPDGQPLKFVEGPEGNRAWDPKALLTGTVEGLLAQQLGPKAYEPQKTITAPAAAKLLDKKATRKIWEDIFKPMIKRPKGGMILAWGSDPRPKYGERTSNAGEFDDEDIGVSE